MEFLDIHEGLMVSERNIVALEAIDMTATAVHVQFGNEVKVYQKNLNYSVLRDILLARKQDQGRQIDSTVSRSLEQLAKYQAIPVP